MEPLPSQTSLEVGAAGYDVAVLPIGSFEQHGSHLPLSTDSLIAAAIAEAIATRYGLFRLAPVTFGCSHEHASFPGTVSISASTLATLVDDIRSSLAQQGIERLVIVNGHGGNYVLSNIVQEANTSRPTVALFPGRDDWESARRQAGMESSHHDDMHGGELETSIMLSQYPELTRAAEQAVDVSMAERPFLSLLGMSAYTESGIIGFPTRATASKGQLAMLGLTDSFKDHLESLTS